MNINFNETSGLIPAIIQDSETNVVLMLGYMNEAAYRQTLETRLVTFFSRRRQSLWVKGETSGNYLQLISIKADCDQDTLLIKVKPKGPTCHKGNDTCWAEKNKTPYDVLNRLETIIENRKSSLPEDSYVAGLFKKGINKMAQKVGEEAVELVIEAKDDNDSLFLNEAADLLFHYLILLHAKTFSLNDVLEVLRKREKKTP